MDFEMAANPAMTIYVYKGSKAWNTYVFLPARDDFSALPESLTQRMGRLQEVMELELDLDRRLARSDPKRVLAAIESAGYYVQMPDPGERLLPNDQLLWPD